MTADEQRIGARLRRARDDRRQGVGPRRGYSREKWAILMRSAAGAEAAQLPGVNSLVGMIKKWERGDHLPAPEYRALYSKVTGIPETKLFESDENRDEALARAADLLPAGDLSERLAAVTGSRIGVGTVADLAARVHRLRLADDLLAGRDMLEPAFRELTAVERIYREGTYPETIGRELLSAIGECAQIAGWVASDAGQIHRAAETYQLGIDAAHEAGDRPLESNLIGSLAYQTANVGFTEGGVELAEQAVAAAADASPRARALAWDRLAWSSTHARDAPTAVRALGEASVALADDRHSDDDPRWLYWVDADELQIMKARVYTELHRPLRAVPLLVDILGRYDVTHARELALYLSWLAVALLDAHEPEAAASASARMIELSHTVGSDRATRRAALVIDRLRPFRDVPEVGELLGHQESTAVQGEMR
jgi:hypothetical protein